MFERFTEGARQVVVFAQHEAQGLRHNYIGTEHILLGIVRENEGVAARILLDFDADSEMIRNEVLRVVSGKEPSGRAPREPGELTESFRPIALRGFRPGRSLPHRSRQISMGVWRPWWQPIVHHTDFWFGMVLGSLLLGAGLLVGWLIWA